MSAWIDGVSERCTRAVHGGPGPGGHDPGIVDFSVNVNPFGPAPAVAEAWKTADAAAYPDPASLAARRSAARAWGLPLDRVRFGAGATDFLHRAALAWLAPGDVGVVPEPCFAEYARAVALARGRVVTVPPIDDRGTLALDGWVEASRENDAKITYVGRPNTPTGESVPMDDLLRVRAALPNGCLLVLDESFLSFEAGSVCAPPAVGIRAGVLGVRSVTKDCGLPGLRAGFAVGPERVLRALDRVALPWAASAPAQLAAQVSFEPESAAYLDHTIGLVRQELAILERALRRAALRPRASGTNFLCAQSPLARDTAEQLERRGIRVRQCASFGLPDHLRIGVRRPDENRRLLHALEEIRCG